MDKRRSPENIEEFINESLISSMFDDELLFEDENSNDNSKQIDNTDEIDNDTLSAKYEGFKQITTLKEIEKYLDIRKNEIIAKKLARVHIDKKEYKEDQISETAEYYLLPGILEIYFPDNFKFIQLPFTFPIKLIKNDTVIDTKNEILIEYKPGETIIKQKFKAKELSFKSLNRILEGTVGFLRTPEQYVQVISDLLNHSIDLVHIELLVQHIFRCKDNNYEKPCRLCNYKNCEVIGISKLPKYTSWLLALEFERVKSVIKHALINKTPLKGTAFEKIFLEYWLITFFLN